MAQGDIEIINDSGFGVKEFVVDDRTTSGQSATFKPGEVVKRDVNYVKLIDTGDVAIGSDVLAGLVTKTSTETSSADGVVDVDVFGPGTMIRGKATTTTNVDTAAEILAIKLNYIYFDNDGTNITIDENDTSDPNKACLCVIDGDYEKYTLDCLVHINATLFGSLVGQTMD